MPSSFRVLMAVVVVCLLELSTVPIGAVQPAQIIPAGILQSSNPVVLRETRRVGNGTALAAAWSPNNKTLAIGGSLGIWLYTADLKPMAHLDGNTLPISALAWSPDGKQIATVSQDRLAQIWDLHNSKVQTLIEVPPTGLDLVWYDQSGTFNYPGTVSYNPDGSLLATANFDKTVRIWDTKTGRLVRTFSARGPAYYAYWSPDGKRLAVSGTYPVSPSDPSSKQATEITSHYLEIWDAQSGQVSQQYNFADDEEQIEQYGLRLAPWTKDGNVLLWNPGGPLGTGQWDIHPYTFIHQDAEIAGNTGPYLVNATPDGRFIAFAISWIGASAGTRGGATVQIFGPNIRGELAPQGNSIPSVLTWSSDGRCLAVLYDDGYVDVVDTTTIVGDPRNFLEIKRAVRIAPFRRIDTRHYRQ